MFKINIEVSLIYCEKTYNENILSFVNILEHEMVELMKLALNLLLQEHLMIMPD